MQIRNTINKYGIVSILLHWIIAIIVIGMLTLGIYMSDLPNSLYKLKLYGWHKEWGFVVLFLITLRIIWKMRNVSPSLTAPIPYWQIVIAKLTHWMFYLILFVMPITGWIITSSANLPVSFFGFFVIPVITSRSKNVQHLFANIHSWVAYILIALIVLHILAALKHAFIDKDDILKRMLP